VKPNPVKHSLAAGGHAIGTMIAQFAEPEIGRILAAAGFEFVVIDNEHGAFTLESNLQITIAARPTGLVTVVRVPDAEYHLIARTLDSGAEGVMVPRVETREAVERIVAAVKYPPLGRRGYGLRAMPDAIAHVNDNTLIIIQIETLAAVEAIDDLASVPGVDVALIGPADLSISLGVPGQFEHPKMVDAIQRVIDGCKRHGVAAGAHLPTVEAWKPWVKRGMRCLLCSTDENLLESAGAQTVRELRALIPS
jgi:2-keto-3-deoxy-L-rhamnonate aldolase RhmA